MSDEERGRVLATLSERRFVDLAPPQIWARLLDDDGVYLCSVSTMYRLLREHGAVRERRRQARHPAHVKPELVADGPNQVWSWDITKLKGPVKWVWFYLYVVIDVYSRYTPGWLVATRETARLAEELLGGCVASERIGRDQLTIHADRGPSMASKSVALLLADLGVTRSHARPRQSNDNPYSEAQIKTLKYCPTFPERFTSIEHARAFTDTFFGYYNLEHRHSGIGWHTPFDVHHGHAEAVRQARQATLDQAYATHPQRFNHPPQAPRIPEVAWINRPTEDEREPVSNR